MASKLMYSGCLVVKQLFVLVISVCCNACSVVTVADAAVSVVATGVKTTVKAAGAVADAVIPDGDEEDD